MTSQRFCRYRDRGQYDYPPPDSSHRGNLPPTDGILGGNDNGGNNGSGGNPNGGGGMDNFTKALIAGAFIMGMGTGLLLTGKGACTMTALVQDAKKPCECLQSLSVQNRSPFRAKHQAVQAARNGRAQARQVKVAV